MMSNFTLIKAVNFKETPILNKNKCSIEKDYESTQTFNEKNIIWLYQENVKRYCKDLLSCLKKTEIEDLEEFINSLLVQTLHPISWLNNLEKLINLNLLFLGEKASPLFLSTVHVFLDEKRKELEFNLQHPDGLNIRRSNGSYSFKKVKYHLNKIEGFCEKKLFLTKM